MARLDEDEIKKIQNRNEALRRKIREIKQRNELWSDLTKHDWFELKALMYSDTEEDFAQMREEQKKYREKLRNDLDQLRQLKPKRVSTFYGRAEQNRRVMPDRRVSIEDAFEERRASVDDRRHSLDRRN